MVMTCSCNYIWFCSNVLSGSCGELRVELALSLSEDQSGQAKLITVNHTLWGKGRREYLYPAPPPSSGGTRQLSFTINSTQTSDCGRLRCVSWAPGLRQSSVRPLKNGAVLHIGLIKHSSKGSGKIACCHRYSRTPAARGPGFHTVLSHTLVYQEFRLEEPISM